MTSPIFWTIFSVAVGAVPLTTTPPTAIGQETEPIDAELEGQRRPDHHQAARLERCTSLASASNGASPLESLQIETGNILLYERFFEQFLHAQPVFRMDHPLVDLIRTYCYRHILIVIRQDLKTPRPTGWVQMNFLVRDVETIQRELEEAGRRLEATEGHAPDNPFPLRLKRMVPRNQCRVDRLEVSGPEGFMIGFNQIHKETCRPPTVNDDPRP
ncbi:MAG: VOC family protein [Nitrospira sp.]|nr:VOC family protein [Nitrospira sp.]MCP9460789.1 VOC family protein [Nitrospira sp.]MCP9475004.1 VOC family protein [Nitrospira sp.]